MMKNIIKIILCVVVTSFYYFPFEFVFLPGINTKMAMAGMGVVLLGLDLILKRKATLDKDLLVISGYAIAISLISYVSIIYNSTNDPSFTDYPISIWVWWGGAYFVVRFIKYMYGHISVGLMCKYLIAVCTAQCVIAYTMNVYPPLKQFVDGFLGGTEAFMGKAEGRMYGIGAALDVAGFRFAAVLTMIAFICTSQKEFVAAQSIKLYVLAFLIISVIGNMISRSTIFGVGLGLIYMVWATGAYKNHLFWKWIIGLLMITIPILIYLYNTNDAFRTNIRFGFEGFFSLVEKGQWQMGSNDILFDHMLVFPETIKTWIIGDGYAANPDVIDPYYTGQSYHGFYKGTDIGYIRFIFYFGLIGAFALVAFICKVAFACVRRFPSYKLMFLMILAINLIGWLKVSTDIFLVFAPFLCISASENEEAEEGLKVKG